MELFPLYPEAWYYVHRWLGPLLIAGAVLYRIVKPIASRVYTKDDSVGVWGMAIIGSIYILFGYGRVVGVAFQAKRIELIRPQPWPVLSLEPAQVKSLRYAGWKVRSGVGFAPLLTEGRAELEIKMDTSDGLYELPRMPAQKAYDLLYRIEKATGLTPIQS